MSWSLTVPLLAVSDPQRSRLFAVISTLVGPRHHQVTALLLVLQPRTRAVASIVFFYGMTQAGPNFLASTAS